MIRVGPIGPGLDLDAELAVVVADQRRRRAITRGGQADRRPEQIGQAPELPYSTGVGQQVPDRCRPERLTRRSEAVGAKVLADGIVEIDQAPLPQLHDRDRGEGLRDRADPEDGVLCDGWLASAPARGPLVQALA
jgi:hypothetical protein